MTLYIVWIANALFLLLGFTIGQAVQWKRRDVRGVAVAMPSIKLNARRVDTILALGVAIAMVGTLGTAAYSQQQSAECMKELWVAIEARSDATDEARNASRRLVEGLAELVTMPEEMWEGEAKRLALVYDGKMADVNRQLNDSRLMEQEHC